MKGQKMKMMEKRKTEVIVCPECGGRGTVSNRDTFYDSDDTSCGYCWGKRVVFQTEITKHEAVED